MKRPNLTRLAVLCVVALGSLHALADPPTPAAAAEYKMMRDGWCGWPGTGNADRDFALRMRHHHLMGIDMARDELARGTDPQLRAFAQHEIDLRTPELAQLEAWLTGQHVVYTYAPYSMYYRAHFEAMDLDHDGQIEASEVDASHPWHENFALADANHDGMVSSAEIDAWRPPMRPMRPWARFEDLDTNNDGMVSRTELDAYRPMHGGMRFEAMDTNHDGVLDSTEVVVGSPWYPNFAVADTNHDGKVSHAEADAWHLAHKPMMDRDHDGDIDASDCRPWMGYHDVGGNAHSAPMPAEFAGMDRNGDGYLTLDELPQSNWARDHFTAFDADGNGQISKAEFEAHHAMMESMRH